jgi:hypothetical protein
MEIKTKYNIGQHIWVVYEHMGEVCVYDAIINEISIDSEGTSYWIKEGRDIPEEYVIAYEDTNKLVAMIKDTMNTIHEREEKRK